MDNIPATEKPTVDASMNDNIVEFAIKGYADDYPDGEIITIRVDTDDWMLDAFQTDEDGGREPLSLDDTMDIWCDPTLKLDHVLDTIITGQLD